MKKPKDKELVLKRETIRKLSQEEERRAFGGGNTDTCGPDCTQCTSPNPATCTRQIPD